MVSSVGQTSLPDSALLTNTFQGFINSKVLLCASQYHLADHVGTLSPCTVTELAAATGLQERGLFQVMRYLREMGYFEHNPKTGTYCNNRLSSLLRKDHWSTWKNWVEFFPREYYDILCHLPDQLSNGETKTASELFYNTDKPIYQYLADTGKATQFHKVTGTGSVVEAPGILADYPWAEIESETLLDIGAGAGDFIRSYLQRYTTATASALELPPAAEILKARFPKEDPLSSRLVSVVGGDFLADALPRVSVYFMRWILHNWGDDDCIKLLRRVRDAMIVKAGVSRLLVSEIVLSDGRLGRGGRYADIRMLVHSSAKERTLEEYCDLAKKSGWRLHRLVLPKGCLTHIIELRPVGDDCRANGPPMKIDGLNSSNSEVEWDSELM